ncbi:hypothetical protein [Dyadobacter sp. CY312]|uniref:hypothetical protein n=1 Tax=Dyadobacter sp. CY312 TaxID=2907303 RepID=UPI001F405ACB|nr:hypothetical protein [Dyadobacter sp. CY312]MCE7042680.1 hypothetical protein [Dyadobacter sp. CY312]
MKSICLFILMSAYSIVMFAQDQVLKKGNAVYVEVPKSDVGSSAGQELKEALQSWGYWKVASSKGSADFVLKLDTKVSGGVTWTSWGGKSVALSASFLSKNNEELWQSEYYKSSPNGANGYNSQSAAVKKLMKALRKKFQ